jgi:type VI protein secretion system component VasF
MLDGRKIMTSPTENSNEEKNFGEFRRKVKSAEVLSASMEHLLLSLGFTGRVSVVMQNGRVLKSGYEEGYFHQRHGRRGDDESAH